ncbi:putative porin [Bradyrhizobium sp. HKCCYLS3077]|uniref:putative porin n=1 Tax=Bradyrhizobium sp. HKCCYLS3077 TaxID=3420761 RepID=UPI003EB6B2DA
MAQADIKMQGMAAAAAVLMLAAAGPAAAQDDNAPARRPSVSRSPALSSNATVNLINLLVKQGVLSDEQAAALVKQADDEAYVARQAVSTATSRADDAAKTAAAAANATSPPGTKRVTYVPEIVKKQLRDEIRQEVMAKAEKENWASPGKYPEWAQRLRFYGDVRVRYEGDFFGKQNDPLAVNYNAINTGSPYDVSALNQYVWPTLNTDQNRNRARLRARLGMDADLFDGFSAGMRLGTGDGSSPVSFNATLGGSGGNFSKYGIWLDRGFVKYRVQDLATLQAGRFDNPFFSPTDLLYHRDLGFDGFSAQIRYPVSSEITPFAVGGAFPIFNTDINAGSVINLNNGNATFGKARSEDRWMFGGQLGANTRLMPDVEFTLAAAYYDFTNVQGRLSTPCIIQSVQDSCSTDLKRPLFAQRGNTYMPLRDARPIDANGNPALGPAYQYFGLASAFRDLVISSRLDLGHFHPVHIILDGEFVQNLAWDRQDIAAKILNSPLPSSAIAPCTNGVNCGQQIYAGGNKGYLGRLTVGHRELKELWDWNAFVGYKYLESDAVIDAFTDSDFGLGGTNLKGYFIGGNVAIGPNTSISARWLSANQVAGAPYAVDVFQVDLNARF